MPRPRNATKARCVTSGAAHTVTGPVAAAHAVSMARAISDCWNAAAPSAPSTGIKRVLAKPGIGALARIAIATGSVADIAVELCQFVRVGAEVVGESQPPHQHDGA